MSKMKSKPLLILLLKLAVIALAVWAILRFVIGLYRMEGNGMYPAIRDGDLCVTYKLDDYFTHDVAVYRDESGAVSIGRIVAREGDALDVDERGLLINGVPPMEEIFYPTDMSMAKLNFPVRLEPGEVFILNDFRSDSRDSRIFGIQSTDELQGKVILILRIRGI